MKRNLTVKMIACVAVILWPDVTRAQQQTQLGVGSVVRITPQRGKPIVGRVATLTLDSIGVYRTPGPDNVGMRFSRNDFRTVQVYGGRSRAHGALKKGFIGLSAGALVGAVLGFVTYSRDDSACGRNEFCICIIACDPAEAAAFGGMLLGGAGLIGGAIYGAATGTEKWIEVPRR